MVLTWRWMADGDKVDSKRLRAPGAMATAPPGLNLHPYACWVDFEKLRCEQEAQSF